MSMVIGETLGTDSRTLNHWMRSVPERVASPRISPIIRMSVSDNKVQRRGGPNRTKKSHVSYFWSKTENSVDLGERWYIKDDCSRCHQHFHIINHFSTNRLTSSKKNLPLKFLPYLFQQ